jgi:predicted nucleic acid-binding protein
MKILVDTNIVLDVLLEREPFYAAGTKVLGLSEGGIELFVSASAITDIYYITRKQRGSKTVAMTLLEHLLLRVEVAAVTGTEIRRAISLGWSDLEDAVQYASGERLAVDYVVTRNSSHFAPAILPVVTPDELLRAITKGPN